MAGRPKRRQALGIQSRLAIPAGLGKTVPQAQRTMGAFMAAPVGGVNTTSPAAMMPPTDCLLLVNRIPFQFGLRLRTGTQDWATGMHENAPLREFEEVRTVITFSGSATNGSRDRLFACTFRGIYDITAPVISNQIDPVYTFPSYNPAGGATVFPDANAGRGVFTAFTNTAGNHYLLYADGTNGYLLYSEISGTWQQVNEFPVDGTPWAKNTAYILGDQVTNNGMLYVCTLAGTSSNEDGATGPNTGSRDIVDGTAQWDWVPTITGVNPGSFRFVMVWKNRVWFVKGDSQDAYYLDVGAFAGTAKKLSFAPRFKYGGDLVGLWSWTLDGGTGIDDLLVGISRGGDVVVYQGTDPSYAETFGLRGVWWVGPVPPGRNVASDFGGDLFILSLQGCLPLSSLVAGGLIRDPSIYVTAKVANLFNRLMSERGGEQGWSLTMHPTDNLLVVNVPGRNVNEEAIQLVMSLATKGWAAQRGIDASCLGTWHGKMYYGMPDGRVLVSQGATDSGRYPYVFGEGAWRYGDNGPQAIDWSMLTSYQNLGSATKKRVHMIRPYFMTSGTVPGYAAQARYDYALDDVPLANVSTIGAVGDTWGTGLWNTALWGPPSWQAHTVLGASGMGVAVAVALRGTSKSTDTLVGMDIMFDQGGLL